MSAVTKRGHRHVEAFELMTYATDDGKEMEAIWNSRDGGTPFVIHSRSGREMTHVDWHKDVYNPSHQPRPGDRIFVDLTAERARQSAEEGVDLWWDHREFPMSAKFETKEDAVAAYLNEVRPGDPMLVEVGPEGWPS